MNRCIAAGGAILLSLSGSPLSMRGFIAVARGDAECWRFLAIGGGMLIAAVGYRSGVETNKRVG